MQNNFSIILTKTAREALLLISEIAIPNIAVFIVDENNKLVGSLTDGDIRRGLLKGLSIDDSISMFMHTNYKFFKDGEDNFDKLNTYKSLGIRFVPYIDEQNKIVRIADLDEYRSLIPVDAILMAGGKGERLKPLTDSTPKPMLKIGDKPIIVRNIERIAKYGINHFHISVRHLSEQIVEGLKECKGDNVIIDFVKEDKPLGTIGSVKLIKEFVNDSVLLMNSDILTNINFQDFYLKFIDSKSDMQVATVPYNIDVPYAIMDVNDKGDVMSFKEKPRYTYYSNAGIYLFKKELIDLIPDNIAFDATHFMETVIANNKKLISYPILGYWLDIGRIEDYYKAQEDIKHLIL